MPVIRYFKQKYSEKVMDVNAEGSIEEIYGEIWSKLDKDFSSL